MKNIIEVQCEYDNESGFWCVKARETQNSEGYDVIAYIDNLTGRVAYHNKITYKDEQVQKVIQEKVSEITARIKTEQETEEKIFKEKCDKEVKTVARELEDIVAGKKWLLDGQIVSEDEIQRQQEDEHSIEPYTIYEYHNNRVYDMEFIVDVTGRYKGVRLLVGGGGPTIYVSTVREEVQLFWWGTTASCDLSKEVVEALDEYYEELNPCT